MVIFTMLVGVLSISFVNKVGRSGEDAGIKYAPLIDAAMEVKLTATRAHLLFEEIIAGDPAADIQQVWDLLEQTRWYGQAILSGGKNDEGTFVATEDQKVKQVMTEVMEKVEAFIKMAHLRYSQSQNTQGAGSNIDQVFDGLYENLQTHLSQWQDVAVDRLAIDDTRRLGEVKYQLANGHLFLEELFSGDNENNIESILSDFNAAKKNIEATKDFGSNKKQQLLVDMMNFINVTEERFSTYTQNTGADSKADEEFDLAFESFISKADEAETFVQASMSGAMTAISTQKTNAVSAVVTILLITLVLGLVMAFLLSRNLSNPIIKVLEIANTIAKGNLSTDITANNSDETGQLTAAMGTMNKQLRDLVTDVLKSNDGLQLVVEKIVLIAQQAGNGVQKQLSETHMAATAVTQVSNAVKEVSYSANKAATAASDAEQQASQGQAVIDETIHMIHLLAEDVSSASIVISKLEEQSNLVGSVLEVIGGIADQTNLLALNAAIEAARAGEQGRGFAVVADEVRTLAKRTQESTQQIKDIIESLQSDAHDAVIVMKKGSTQALSCVEQAGKAGPSLDSINNAVSTINNMNKQIANASEELSLVITELNQNMANIHQEAEINNGKLQELSATGEELSTLTQSIQHNVSKFTV